ncbi:MAG: T9SS type A sorting domain-containing protein [Chitinophagales bacterium]|nr:T9SS type A sorting domain-containing protein [Chitinophagales bacterium]
MKEISRMKKIFLLFPLIFLSKILLAQVYTVPGAQVQPAWVFPLWFEDGSGAKDTIYYCYDPTADNFGISEDTVFGERFLEEDTLSFFVSMSDLSNPNQDIAIKVGVKNELPSGNIYANKAKLPFKIKWDKNLFYDSILLTIPVTDRLPYPLFQIDVECGDFDPDYNNCPTSYPLIFVPEDPIGCCPNGFFTDSFTFIGDTVGPQSYLATNFSLIFSELHIPLGISVIQNKDTIFVYPNPATGLLHLNIPATNSGLLQTYNSSGKLIQSLIADKKELEIDVSYLSSGIYMIQFFDNHHRYFNKFIKL